MRAVRFASIAAVALVAVSACRCDEELQEIPRVGDVRGVICGSADGQPLGGVTLTVTDAEGTSFPATTDASGAFAVQDLTIGIATVVVADPAGSRQGSVVVVENGFEEYLDGECRAPPPAPSGSVSGCVCDESVGRFVADANVFIALEGGNVAVTGTDADGCFVLDGVPAGDHLLQVQSGSFSEEHQVTVVVGETTPIVSPASCAQDPPPPVGDTGIISGRVCAPDGTTWLAGADVTVTLPGGARITTTTDADGFWRLEGVPVGRQTVDIVKGSFSTSRLVDVFVGQTTTIPEDECAIEAINLRIAVVTGDYDRVEDVLGSIGIQDNDVDLYPSSFLNAAWVDDLVMDYAVLSQYDIVFLNCGLSDLDFVSRFFANATASANLRQFVQEGGSVYASDWAYYVVEKTWPDFVDFVGDDASGDNGKVGAAPRDVDANIVDAPMALALGQTSMVLHYPLLSWVVMESASPATTVYIRGDAEIDTGATLRDVPHTVAFRPGLGRVLFTSFHQEAGINPDMQRVLQLLIFEL